MRLDYALAESLIAWSVILLLVLSLVGWRYSVHQEEQERSDRRVCEMFNDMTGRNWEDCG